MAGNLEHYFREVSKHSLLTKAQEVTLAKRIEGGDKNARDMMINSNLRLAINIAKKYRNSSCDWSDIVQESNIGLIKAVDRFDWRRGFKFSTYACWWIRQSIVRFVSANSTTMKLPINHRSLLWKVKVLTDEYRSIFGTAPKNEELADILDINVKTLTALINTSASRMVYLDQPLKSDESSARTYGEMIEDTSMQNLDDVVDNKNLMRAIKATLSSLTTREEMIMRLRFGITEEIGDHDNFPITNEEIKTLEERAENV